ncbi:MAG: hypothetical protein ABSG03_04275 [Bryobacteraceae bacterium]
MPPTGIDRARAIFWLQLASLLATAWVIWKIAIIPFVRIGVGFWGFLPQTIFLALGYSLAALLLSGAITFLLLLAVRRIERAETIGVTLRTCAAGVWFAPAAILLGSSSPLATTAALVLVVSVTRVLYSQWRLSPKLEPAEPTPSPQEGLLFGSGELPTGFLPRDFWPAMAVALALQMGWASSSIGRKSAAAAFYAVAAALLTAYGIAAGVWARDRQAVLPRAIMGVAVTLLLTVFITILGTIMLMGGGGEEGSAGGSGTASIPAKPPPPPPLPLPGRKYDPPPIDPARLGPAINVPGGFPGVILWPETAPIPILVEPMPKGEALSKRLPSHPFVIPFSGAYWMFRWPFTRPPANSFVRRGTPSEMSFSTVDGWPLTMEAHQRLDRETDLSWCGKVQLVIWNADRYPGTVTIELGLIDRGRAPFRLGPERVNSMPDLTRDPVVPVSETLEFTVPSDAPRFDEFDVIYHRFKLVEYKSARIAIEKFVLVPR